MFQSSEVHSRGISRSRVTGAEDGYSMADDLADVRTAPTHAFSPRGRVAQKADSQSDH